MSELMTIGRTCGRAADSLGSENGSTSRPADLRPIWVLPRGGIPELLSTIKKLPADAVFCREGWPKWKPISELAVEIGKATSDGKVKSVGAKPAK